MATAPDQFRQLRRDRVAIKVLVAGVDVSSRFNPRLLQLSILDKTDQISEARLELDDKYGQIAFPEGALGGAADATSADVTIELGWPQEGSYQVFKGSLDDIESRGDKRGGRILTITAAGHDLLTSKIKAPMRWNLGDGSKDESLHDALAKAAKLAGVEVAVSSKLGNLSRKFWMANNESFMAYGARIADEVGGVFKIVGKNASLTEASAGTNTVGAPLTAITAAAGVNLIAWSIHPRQVRPAWKSAGHMYFDMAKGVWKRIEGAMKSSTNTLIASADLTGIGSAADDAEAGQKAGGDVAKAYRHRGYGWVVIDGEPQAIAQSPITISGARPGVDGNYTILTVEHFISRQTGYICRIDVDSFAGTK